MMTLNAPSPFTKRLQLRIESAQNGNYTVQGFTASGTAIEVETLISSLFFTYEANTYGLMTNRTELSIDISTAELLDIFSLRYSHPFIRWQGINAESSAMIEQAQKLQQYWQEPSLWSHAVIADDFSSLSFTIEGEDTELLEIAVQQKLAHAGLLVSDVPKLLPFFERGGWPLEQDRQAGAVTVSLRLSEPEEDSEVWLLETVLSTVSTKNYWTPAVRKKLLPLVDALPAKWQAFALDIEQQQTQIVELLSIEDLQPDVFIQVTLDDLEVRKFLREDLARLQALGFDVVLPAWLKDLKQSKIRVRVSTGNISTKKVAGLDDILTFKWTVNRYQPSNLKSLSMKNENSFVLVQNGSEWMPIGCKKCVL